jgi:hypothetical protein
MRRTNHCFDCRSACCVCSLKVAITKKDNVFIKAALKQNCNLVNVRFSTMPIDVVQPALKPAQIEDDDYDYFLSSQRVSILGFVILHSFSGINEQMISFLIIDQGVEYNETLMLSKMFPYMKTSHFDSLADYLQKTISCRRKAVVDLVNKHFEFPNVLKQLILNYCVTFFGC